MIWVLGAVMMLAAIVIVLFPLWRSHVSQATLDSNTANVALLKDQLNELEADFANGNINQEQYDLARTDLETAVAADLTEDQSGRAQLTIKTRRLLSVLIAVALPLATLFTYRELTTYQDLPSHGQQVQQAMEQVAGEKLPPIDQMVEGLAAKLRQNPDDAEGWQMLARTYVILQRYAEAASAYGRAYDLLGDTDAALITDYAEALAQAGDGDMAGLPEQLVQRALRIEPALPKALWLTGFAAVQRGAYEEAIEHWTTLLRTNQLDDETRNMVQAYLADARAKLGLPDTPDEPVASTIEAVDVDLTGSTVAMPAAIKVQVSLDPQLIDQARKNEVVFVFAKAVSGMPAPLAVTRLTVADLPTTVLLDDSLAMMPGHNLSSKDQVIVGARVSRSGSPMTQPGDLQGLSESLDTASVNEVNVVINQVVEN